MFKQYSRIFKVVFTTVFAKLLRHILRSRRLVTVRVCDVELIVFPRVFNPREGISTFVLLASVLNSIRRHIKSVRLLVETCCGCGLIGVALARVLRGFVVLVDVDWTCARNAKLNSILAKVHDRVDVICASLLSCLRDSCVDVVVCNPPYLPCPQSIDLALCAGTHCELITQLLLDCARCLKPGGKLFLTLSSLSTVNPSCTLLSKVWLVTDWVYALLCTREQLLMWSASRIHGRWEELKSLSHILSKKS